MKPLKIAMLSLTHGHTRKYFQTLACSPKLDWVAACAADEIVGRRFEGAVRGVPCYDDEEEMFDRHPEIEAAVLASANSEHLRQVEACARRGIHVLSMKIPSFDLAEYDRMIELVDEAGVVCQIELELHYNPVVRRVKQLVADGAVGKILSVQATNITLSPVWAFPWQGSPEASYGSRVALGPGDRRFRGGALCDHPHIFEPGACKHCDKTGYVGRTAICDVLVVDNAYKAEIARGEALTAKLRTDGNRKGQSNLRKQGLRKVVAGVTSREELKRVVG